MPRFAAALALLVLAALLPAGAASAAPAADPVRVLLQLDVPFSPPGLLTAGARSAQQDRLADARQAVLRHVTAGGGRTLRTYDGLPFVAVEGDGSALRRITGVSAVLPDEAHRVSLDESAPHIGAPTVWDAGVTGTGQAVAVLDTGVEADHPFLTGKVVAEACFARSSTCPDGSTQQIGPGSAAPCTYDEGACPHGTHVAGIVAGAGTTSAGIARGADLIAVQVFSRSTSGCPEGAASCAIGFTSDLLAGLDHVATLAASRPVAAVNLSLGGGAYSGTCDADQPALATAVDALRSLGVATAAATGNAGSASAMSAPACLSGAVAVGSTSLTDVVSTFSNSSPELDLLAPGEKISSSYTQGRTAWMSGTSQSAPHVAGSLALLRQAHPTASVDELLTALTTGGVPVLDTRNGRLTPRVQVDAALTVLDLAAAAGVEPIPEPTSEPTAEPSPEPTTEPSPAPTAEPSPAPTAEPSPEPTTEPSPAPTTEPSPAPTTEPSPVPVAEVAPAPAPTGTRLSGDDRYDTAATIYSAGFGCESGGASAAVLARGDAFADALAGGYLAGTRDTGVLLTGTAAVPASTLAALRGSGARTVYLLGGLSAIGQPVADQLARTPSYDCDGVAGDPLEVVRIAGTNRFDTARQAAEHPGAAAVGSADLTGQALRTAVVASGTGFADALAAGPLSYARGFPTLLTGRDVLAPEAEAALSALGIEQVLLPGGTGVVSAAVEARLETLGLNVVRLAGDNRVATAAAVARFAVDHLGFGATGVALSRGDAFADALAGAAYAGDRETALLLTAGRDVLGEATETHLRSMTGARSLTVFGGTGAVSDASVDRALALLSG